MRLPEPTNNTELQNTEGSLKFLKHQWKSMRQPTTKNPAVSGRQCYKNNNYLQQQLQQWQKQPPGLLKTTATKENQLMTPRYNASSVLDQGKSSKSVSFWKKMPSNSERYTEVKAAKSTADKFIKNRTEQLNGTSLMK